jgi:hypothetical protein
MSKLKWVNLVKQLWIVQKKQGKKTKTTTKGLAHTRLKGQG